MTDLSKEKVQLDEIENQVKNIIIKTLKIQDESKIKKDTKFVDDLGADSLDQIELIMAVEDEYDVQIPDEEVEKIKTVQNVIDYILEHIDKK